MDDVSSVMSEKRYDLIIHDLTTDEVKAFQEGLKMLFGAYTCSVTHHREELK